MDPINILLIEDNEGDIILTTEALTQGKIIHNISVIKNGKKAIDFLEKKFPFEKALQPHLILLDINLPKMNGYEVLQKIKTNQLLKHIPVIMLTSSSSDNDILMANKHFAHSYLTKPVDEDDFLQVVSSIETFWINHVQLSLTTL
jgi:CheY-like chemotaxis protein